MWLILWFCCTTIPQTEIKQTAEVFLIDSLAFSRVDEGRSWGFDIDGLESDDGDEEGCFQSDWVDPRGNTGIDNALGVLAPILELTEAAAVESIIDEHIRNGTILLLLELHADRLLIWRGLGTAMTGTDGRFLDGQSVRYEPSVLVDIALTEDQQMLLGAGFALDLQFSILSNDIIFELQQAVIRIQKMDNGRLWGVLGGKVPLQRLLVIANDDQVGPNAFFVDVLSSAADIDPDEHGLCQFISTALIFEGVPVYLME